MLTFQPSEALPRNHRALLPCRRATHSLSIRASATQPQGLIVALSWANLLENPQRHVAEVTQEEGLCMLRIAFPPLSGILLLLHSEVSGVYNP